MAPFPPDDAGPESGPAPSDAPHDAPARGLRFERLKHGLRSLERRIRRLPRTRVFWGVVALTALAAAGWQRCGIRGCPAVARLASYQPGGASLLLDRNGETIAKLGPVDHAVVEIASLPDYVPAAFVAVEDKRFYRHHGVDWRRVVGAGLANLKAGEAVQGSSTITMQLSRNLFPDRIRAREKTLRRKLLEVRVAREIERRFSKTEILELYLNHIYFGAGAYGIEAAARQYFDRPARKLTLEQAAVLAALPRAPSHYDPREHADAARQRRDLVLALMAEQGHVTARQADAARSKSLRVASGRDRSRVASPRAPYFVAHVRDLLEDRLGEDLYARPLRIHTTLDLRAQEAAEEELEKQIRRVEGGAFGRFAGPARARHETGAAQTDYLQGAVVMLDHETGDVMALVGGRDARESSFDRAIDGKRQTGSAFKPFVYATALTRGWSPSDLLDDSPYRLVSGRETWEPRNADGEYMGPVTLREALVWSRNVPTIRLAEQVGVGRIASVAKAAGIRADMSGTPAIALGVAEASPLELTAAYTAFAAEGQSVTPRFVLRVEDKDGRVLWAPDVERRRVLSPATAFLMTDLLRDVVDHGTGRHVRLAGYHGLAAGKTGTTNDGADTWFVGYTPRLTAAVWIGFDRPRPIAGGAGGGPIAAQAWGRMMNRIPGLAGRSEWERPQQVVAVAVDPETGLALAEGCEPRDGEARTELFLRGREPDTVCPDARPGPSLIDRIGSGIGGRIAGWWDGFLGERPVRVASSDERGRRDEADESEVWRSQERDEWNGPPMWPGGGRNGEWAEDLRDAVQENLERRSDERERVVDWLRQLAETVEDADIEPRDARRIQGWIEGVIRSVEQAERSARRPDDRDVGRWMDGMIDRLGGEQLRPEQRRELQRELRRAARELHSLE